MDKRNLNIMKGGDLNSFTLFIVFVFNGAWRTIELASGIIHVYYVNLGLNLILNKGFSQILVKRISWDNWRFPSTMLEAMIMTWIDSRVYLMYKPGNKNILNVVGWLLAFVTFNWDEDWIWESRICIGRYIWLICFLIACKLFLNSVSCV